MEWMFAGMIVLLFLLAVFDLYVGVSNDAVNFLNSAIGSRAARFRTLLIIAAVGVFCGCVLSNGMMDIARHGIFVPEQFSFREVMYIYMAVMVTDIVLLDVFNTFGMPTSTTVSMVFELLGAAFAFVIIKVAAGGAGDMVFGDYLNTSKALEVIMGIFMSVPIAFVAGSVVQYITRVLFTFHLRDARAWKMITFGGVAITAIVYFMLFKGMKNLSFMDGAMKTWIGEHIGILLLGCFVASTLLMLVLHLARVQVLRIVVLVGTFALATAFAGNDLVNFIGVPLAGLASWTDFSATAGADASTHMMGVLQESASTPLVFLFGAGVVMVVSLSTSRKARHVVETEVGLSRRDTGEEMFGSSRAARSLVRWGNAAAQAIQRHTPARLGRFLDSRFRTPADAMDDGTAYDMLRASVNLVTASLLIALGTSLKLPLSTTFVTFMVAMGTSLSDRAWSRESAVFRITGVLTVIGGWFLTAGVAFTACFTVALLMAWGGGIAVAFLAAAAIFSIIHSQRRYARKQEEIKQGDLLFTEMLSTSDSTAILPMLSRHIEVSAGEALRLYADSLRTNVEGLCCERLRPLRAAGKRLDQHKRVLKNLRRRETICLRRATPEDAVRLSTPFHLVHNALRQLFYGCQRISEPVMEHVDNHFTPLSPAESEGLTEIARTLAKDMDNMADALKDRRYDDAARLRNEVEGLRTACTEERNNALERIRHNDTNLTTESLLIHLLQEIEQLCIETRHLADNLATMRRQDA